MIFDIATLCDAATVSEGKLNVLGAFDTIYAKKVPVVHLGMTVAYKFRIKNKNEITEKLFIKIKDMKGVEIMSLPELTISLNEEAKKKLKTKWHGATFTFLISAIKFEKFGDYSVQLENQKGFTLNEIQFSLQEV